MDQAQFTDKFAVDDEIGGTNSYKLTADGCFQRHNIPRAEQYMTTRESTIRNFETMNREEWAERRLCNTVALLIGLGHRPSLNQDATLEEFVARMKEEGAI